MELDCLSKPMNFKWKIQSVTKTKTPIAVCVAYVDARQVMDRLDESGLVWKDEYKMIGDVLFCGISIKIEGEWITRWDCGTESAVEKEKGASSDAFKRASVKWGIFRFGYKIPIQKLSTKEQNGKFLPVDNSGNIIWWGEQLTDYINHQFGFNFVNQNQLQRMFTLMGEKFESPKKSENWTKNVIKTFGVESTKDLFVKDYNSIMEILSKRPNVQKTVKLASKEEIQSAFESLDGDTEKTKKLSEFVALKPTSQGLIDFCQSLQGGGSA